MNAIVGYVLAAALAFGAGWSVNGWRLGQAHEAQARQASEQARETLRLMTESRDRLAADLKASDDIHAAKLQEAQNETNRLRDRVSVGDQRLRVAVRCPAAADVPRAASAPGVDSSAGAELDPTARSAYFALRDGINRAEAKLAACQGELSKRSLAR